MKNYKIEHKILTTAYCEVMKKDEKPASFMIDNIEFTHWNFNFQDGCRSDVPAWCATAEIQSLNFINAINIFRKKLSLITPKISLISQSYIEFENEPFVIYETTSNLAFFKYTEDRASGGLSFTEREYEALKELLLDKKISEEFYEYWNDAVNTIGQSAKLLLMFSAIEALAKGDGGEKYDKIELILGKGLKDEVFSQNTGLRHRLIHGEYFKEEDNGKNYVYRIHNKVLNYFNTKVLSRPSLIENIAQPQRHIWGNSQFGQWFIKRKDGDNVFSLKDLLDDFDVNGFETPQKYERVYDSLLIDSY